MITKIGKILSSQNIPVLVRQQALKYLFRGNIY